MVVNLSENSTVVDMGEMKIVPSTAILVLKSSDPTADETEKQKNVATGSLDLAPYEGVVLSFVAQYD